LKPKTADESDLIELGDVSLLQPGKPKEIVYSRTRIDGWKHLKEKTSTWVVRNGDRVTAFSPQCTHLGCAYHWKAIVTNLFARATILHSRRMVR